MARPRKTEEPVNDEMQDPREYDEKKAKATGEEIAERMKGSPDVEPVPDGGVFDTPDPREERAEEARAHRQVPLDHSGGQPSPAEVFAAKRRAAYDEDDPFSSPAEQQEMPEGIHNLVCVIHYGGRYRIVGANSIDYLRGRLQNERGEKRLFRFTGDSEWQEIRATGEAIHR